MISKEVREIYTAPAFFKLGNIREITQTHWDWQISCGEDSHGAHGNGHGYGHCKAHGQGHHR